MLQDIQIPGLPGPTTNGGYGPQSISASAGLLAIGNLANIGPGRSEAAGSLAALQMSTMTLSDSSSGFFFNSGLRCEDHNMITNVDNMCVMANSDSTPPFWMSPNTVPTRPIFTYDQRPPTFSPINPY